MTPPLTEDSSALYRATVLDQFGALVTATAVSALLLTLTDLRTGAAINGRNDQNVKGSSGVAVHGVTMYDTLQTDPDGVTYNLKWNLDPLDNPIETDTVRLETHIALFQFVWTGGALKHTVALPVRNLAQATA